MDVARACLESLASDHGATVIFPDGPGHALARALLDGFTRLVPGLREVGEALSGAVAQVPITTPTPFGTTLVVLAPSAMVDGATLLEAGAHELVHVTQVAEVGGLQSMVDYLGSGELRALREASACAVGSFARYLVTGEDARGDHPDAVASSLYHLAPADHDFARAVARGVTRSFVAGALPPFRVALDLATWLRRNAPGEIVPAAFRGSP